MNINQNPFDIKIGDKVDVFFDSGRLSGQVEYWGDDTEDCVVSTWMFGEDLNISKHVVYPEGRFQAYANTFLPGQLVSIPDGESSFITVIIYNIEILFGGEKFKVPVAISEHERIFLTPMTLKKAKKI